MREAGDPGERETGDQPITWPWYVRWLAVAYVLSYFVGTVGLLVLGVVAAVLIARRPSLDSGVVLTVAAACACPAVCAGFRWWFRSFGQRRWPAAKPDAESDAAPDIDRLKASRTTEPSGPRYFFLGLGLLCLAFGGVGLAIAIPAAIAESRLALRAIPKVGTVIETRITRSGKIRHKHGLVEYSVGDRSHRQWLRLFVHNDREPGETLRLWYDPAAEEVAGEPPDPVFYHATVSELFSPGQEVAGEPPNPVGYWLWLPPLSFFAVLGLYLSAAMIRLLLKGEPLTTGPPYPDMTPLARSALLVFGGLGVLAVVVLLFVVFASATLDPTNRTPTERWHSIQLAIGANFAAFVILFAVLTGLVVLCVKAIGSDPQMAHNTGRHLLISSGLAMAAIAIVMSLASIGFGFR